MSASTISDTVTTGGPVIQVDGLIFDYPGRRALFDIDWSVEAGSITALVGPNGAGKTTLMRCIAALSDPVSGRVLINGQNVHDDPRGAHEDMGYLSDFFGLYDDLTVRRCLIYRAEALGLTGDICVRAVERAAQQVNLTDRLEDKAGALSRGLRQRLAIAQAIIHQPKVVLLDEPASGLDPEARMELTTLLKGLAAEGMTLVVSSHILSELEDYSTHMTIIEAGRLVESRRLSDLSSGDAHGWVTLRLVAPDARLASWLAAREETQNVQVAADGLTARFEMIIAAEARHGLLKAMLDEGLGVAEFGAARAGLQDAYMARVKEVRTPQSPKGTGGAA